MTAHRQVVMREEFGVPPKAGQKYKADMTGMRRGHGETTTVVPLVQRGLGVVCWHRCSVLEVKEIYPSRHSQ